MTKTDKPFFNKTVQLKKFGGKGGWTYVPLTGVAMDKTLFGMKRVKGSIDSYLLSHCHIMPFGNKHLFLPVKAAIRKELKKEAGDWVTVVLYNDETPIEPPEEFTQCLKDEPIAYQNFTNFNHGAKKQYIDWVYAAKTEDIKIERMAKAINRIAQGKKL